MKTYLLAFAIFIANQAAFAQTEKGKKFIGGSINLDASSNKHETSISTSNYQNKYTRAEIAPKFGYFIKENFAIGIYGSAGVATSKNVSDYPQGDQNYYQISKNTDIILGMGGLARYYKNITGNFRFFLQGTIGYSHSWYKTKLTTTNPFYDGSSDNSKKIRNHAGLGISPGLVYFLSPKFGLEAIFGSLSVGKSINKDIVSANTYIVKSFNYGLNLNSTTFNVGINYYF